MRYVPQVIREVLKLPVEDSARKIGAMQRAYRSVFCGIEMIIRTKVHLQMVLRIWNAGKGRRPSDHAVAKKDVAVFMVLRRTKRTLCRRLDP